MYKDSHKRTLTFLGIRYFVIKASPSLYPLKDGKEPKDLFIEGIKREEKIKYRKRLYTTKILNETKDKRYIVGLFLKRTETHIIKIEPELEEQDIPNWEKLLFVIDTNEQIIAIEHNTQIAPPKSIKKVISTITNKVAAEYGYEINLSFLVKSIAFWEIINEAQGLYQIAFSLHAPNLFGGSKKANEWLRELKKRHNITRYSFDLRNEKGRLYYEKDELESYRDYADSGGGEWTIGIFDKEKRKRKYKSIDHIQKKSIELDNSLLKNITKNVMNLTGVLIRLLKKFNTNSK